MIFKNKWIQDNYFAKGGCASGNEFIEASYGCMIISKYPCTFYEKNFDSNMGRSLIIAEPCLPDNFLIGHKPGTKDDIYIIDFGLAKSY